MSPVPQQVTRKFFAVVRSAYEVGSVSGATVYLVKDGWDDYHFKVLYTAYVESPTGERITLGYVKIAEHGMGDSGSTTLPPTFQLLDDRFFSLGQDAEYYEALYKVGSGFASNVLRGLRDVAFDGRLYDEAKDEPVFETALMRQVSQFELEGQLRRAALGGDLFERYDFKYTPPRDGRDFDAQNLTFGVHPESKPPTNVHAIIGRNGAGKTYLLQSMINSLLDADHNELAARAFDGGEDVLIFGRLFANLVSVSFSAFDPSDPRLESPTSAESIDYHYVGLKALGDVSADGTQQVRTKATSELNNDFRASYAECREEPRRSRWIAAMSTLGADPGFAESGLEELLTPQIAPDANRAMAIFGAMSSGHKIVTLTMTRLVELVEERTLVLIDEPEGHLHPPLLAAYMRALSDLLKQRNAVSIVATHSPVVLQEVPRTCVIRLRSVGRGTVADRISRQSFGENVGVLTDEVFGLQVDGSGYHDLVRQELELHHSFEDTAMAFEGGLGGEARALLQALITDRQQ